MRDNTATPDLWGGERVIILVNIVVFLNCSCAAALPFCSVGGQASIVELIIANNQARTLVGINGSLTSGVVEHIIFDENELFGAPMRVICP